MSAKTFEQSVDEAAKLCRYFTINQQAFCDPGVKEAHVRQNLIDPFFRALGWDVGNAARVAPQYCEVVVEDGLAVEGRQKIPDYAFRVGTLSKFYVEAKKCGTDIFADPVPAYQLRRYGWSARMGVSILTNFKELGVYDCTLRPRPGDKASRARILYFRFEEYAERWRELWDVFSREAVWLGAFDRYASSKRKRGTSEVDEEFLREIEEWRVQLARNIALRNSSLSGNELNRAVQLTIDRIVFLRMAEDRGLEPWEQLLGLCGRSGVYAGFMKLCGKADDKYNSGLFHFNKNSGIPEKPDSLTPDLAIDDKIFKRILQSLYFAYGSPYEFKVFPVEILGTVYERFLGKIIRLTPGHQAKIEEKPEVRKAGGVYYTPEHIVDYIVCHTIMRKIKGKSPAQLASARAGGPFRVLDMACGSGSFLLKAYQVLLDHCLKWYRENRAGKAANAACSDRSGDWRLTIAEKKRILSAHIFGVDIDTRAVEVAKLSLLLKVLEGESDETVGTTMRLFHERALPSLSDNIKCGNSLIAPDYFDDKLIIDDAEAGRVNGFDWDREFAPAMASGGFDCVIGNPPYIDSELMSAAYPGERKYCSSRYRSASGNWDLFCVFIEKALKLCRPRGVHGFIVPNKLIAADYAAGAREVIAANRLLSFRDYSETPVFPVGVYPVVYTIEKNPAPGKASVSYERMADDKAGGVTVAWKGKVPLAAIRSAGKSPWIFSADSDKLSLVRKLAQNFPKLGMIAKVCGAATVAEAYSLSDILADKQKPDKNDLVFVNSGTIDRYLSLWGAKECRYLGRKMRWPVVPFEERKNLPATRLRQARAPKVIVAGMTLRLECIADMTGEVLAGKSTSIIFPPFDVRCLLAIMNSRLIDFYYRTVYGGISLSRGYLRIGPPQLREIPVRVIDEKDEKDKRLLRQACAAVDAITAARAQLAQGADAPQTRALESRINNLDEEIDSLVFDLYGLTDRETAIVKDEKTR